MTGPTYKERNLSVHRSFDAVPRGGQRIYRSRPNEVEVKLKSTGNYIEDNCCRRSHNCQDGAIAVVIDVDFPDPICRRANRLIGGPRQGFLAYAKSPENGRRAVE